MPQKVLVDQLQVTKCSKVTIIIQTQMSGSAFIDSIWPVKLSKAMYNYNKVTWEAKLLPTSSTLAHGTYSLGLVILFV